MSNDAPPIVDPQRLIQDIRDSLDEAIATHADVLRRLTKLDNSDLHRIIKRLGLELGIRVNDAVARKSIKLKLDDLFHEVTVLVKSAKSIDAVDIEVNRWESDNRAVRYLAANRAALEDGARIRRVYIISPHVTLNGFASLVKTMSKHSRLNHELRGTGQIEVRAIYHEDVPDDCKGKDFAIFDKSKALFEAFDKEWRTTHEGNFTILKSEIDEYQEVFNELWSLATTIKTSSTGDLHLDTQNWEQEVRHRIAPDAVDQDMFIGYCSKAAKTAEALDMFFTKRGCRVLRWETDFLAGRHILQEIERMDHTCASGIFLFTKDDPLDEQIRNEERLAAPRDNVVFEAGYFMSRRGPKRTLIILENGAKMPADLGGIIRVNLKDRTDISPIEKDLEKWLADIGGPIATLKSNRRKTQ